MRKESLQLVVALILAAAFYVNGCGPEVAVKKKKVSKAAKVAFATADETRIVDVLETTGDVVAVNTITLRASVEGPIAFCPWREGDRVEKVGQRLVEINRPIYLKELQAAEAALAVAKAKLQHLEAGARPEEIAQSREMVRQLEDCTSFAKADLGRISNLVKSGTLPAESAEKARVSFVKCQTQLAAAKEQLAMLEAGPTKTELAVQKAVVAQALAKVAVYKAKLDECILEAPFAGVISRVFVRQGDLATPRAPLVEMFEESSLAVQFAVPERLSSSIFKGNAVKVQLDAYPEKSFNAHVVRIYSHLEKDSRSRMVEAKMLEPVTLFPGQFARVSVEARVLERAVVVPTSAIVSTARGHKVAYVVVDGKAMERRVTIGVEQGSRVQIVKGINRGEKIVTAGNLNLKDGVAVSFVRKPIKHSAQGGEGL